jgi:hypothetical protein
VLKGRFVAILIDPGFLQNLSTAGRRMPWTKCISGLPEGAIFQYGFYDPTLGKFGAIFEHPSYPEIDVLDPLQIPVQEVRIKFET